MGWLAALQQSPAPGCWCGEDHLQDRFGLLSWGVAVHTFVRSRGLVSPPGPANPHFSVWDTAAHPLVPNPGSADLGHLGQAGEAIGLLPEPRALPGWG